MSTDRKPMFPKKVMPEKIYLRCSKGCFWFKERNHAADTEYVSVDKVKARLNDLGVQLRSEKYIVEQKDKEIVELNQANKKLRNELATLHQGGN